MIEAKIMRYQPLSWAGIAIILTSVLIAASCSRGSREDGPRTIQPASVPLLQTDEPIIALVGRSLSGAPFLHFVLYGVGTVIFSNPEIEPPQYSTVRLTPEQKRQLYASISPDTVREWNERIFTPSSTFLASCFLLIRDVNGGYLRTATYSLPPYEALFPEELRPPRELSTILGSLAHYSAAGTSEWMPPEIEVQFTSAVPSPGDKAWWPRGWPQPKLDIRSQVAV